MAKNLTTAEWARHYGVSTDTISRWRKMDASLDDAAAMDLFRMRLRSRTGVSKYNRRTTTPTTPKPEPEMTYDTPILVKVGTLADLHTDLEECYRLAIAAGPDALAKIAEIAKPYAAN